MNSRIISIILFSILIFTQTIFPASSTWVNFNKGLEQAQKEKKNIVVDFYTDWCHWCKVMDQKTFKDKNVAVKLKEFVMIRLNAESDDSSLKYKDETYTNAEFTRSLGVNGFPTLAFLNPKGEVITVVPGYVPPETFLNILN